MIKVICNTILWRLFPVSSQPAQKSRKFLQLYVGFKVANLRQSPGRKKNYYPNPITLPAPPPFFLISLFPYPLSHCHKRKGYCTRIIMCGQPDGGNNNLIIFETTFQCYLFQRYHFHIHTVLFLGPFQLSFGMKTHDDVFSNRAKHEKERYYEVNIDGLDI